MQINLARTRDQKLKNQFLLKKNKLKQSLSFSPSLDNRKKIAKSHKIIDLITIPLLDYKDKHHYHIVPERKQKYFEEVLKF